MSCSLVGLEHLPTKQTVTGSSPVMTANFRMVNQSRTENDC